MTPRTAPPPSVRQLSPNRVTVRKKTRSSSLTLDPSTDRYTLESQTRLGGEDVSDSNPSGPDEDLLEDFIASSLALAVRGQESHMQCCTRGVVRGTRRKVALIVRLGR